MILFKYTIKNTFSGKGLFVSEYIKKGTLVAIFTNNIHVISEEEFNHVWTHDNELGEFQQRVRRGGIRLVDDYFLVPQNDQDPCDFINHSDMPTLLYHCGLGFARFDLQLGDELTCDYRFFDTATSDNFKNSATGEILTKNKNGRQLLMDSTRKLLDLLETSDSNG